MDKIAKEARKFGIALLAASQAPGHFSQDFLGNVGTEVLLGLDGQGGGIGVGNPDGLR
jgi:hypothetical protein